MFSIQSAKDSLKGMADWHLEQLRKETVSQETSKEEAIGQKWSL
jgi:hypothetical protein